MKAVFLFGLIFLSAAQSATSQSIVSLGSAPLQRPRVVSTIAQTSPTPSSRPTATPTPESSPAETPQRVIVVGNTQPRVSPSPNQQPSPTATPRPTPAPSAAVPTNPAPLPNAGRTLMTYGQFRTRVAEAKRFLQSRPVQTASTEDPLGLNSSWTVTLAAVDPKTQAMHTIAIPKETFLKVGSEMYYTTSLGKLVRVRTIRANGVNTAVTVFDNSGQPYIPLVVQYPVERGGKFVETAYYTSAHPALISPEVSKAGQLYLRTVFETALKKLREHNKFISPHVVAAAEDLAVIEHVDHFRFLNESRTALYDEILALFALNEGNTYRFAVSSAGAGGLAQMIPSTYRMVRNMHPTVPLTPDFVVGMRDHINAAQAMLLYMQDTWNDLSSNQTIASALESGIATDVELMAAGYNSNPARLAGYIRRGGANWRYLIPRETQMYLQIQKSVQSTIVKLPPVKQ
ncbi:MAG: hypothetical protein M3209_01915 [Acidobacteriota bacterium]|nr:hypothetical protein [Acidobacteriota bacterium]